jgi:hypothetical protein
MKKEQITLFWYYDLCKKYQWSKDGKICINIETNNIIQRVYNNGSIGYNIEGKFKALKTIRKGLKQL